MKNKERLPDDYQQLRTKIFVRALIMVLVSVGTIWLLYRFVLSGNAGNWMVAILEGVFKMEPGAAQTTYATVFRRYSDAYFLVGATILFFIIFRIYLNWFTKYFVEINKGIDALITEDAGDVVLSPELTATEKKINAIKRTLERRKLDAQLSEQQKSDLIVYLAHDLKTPLTTVIGYLTLLRDEPDISTDLRAKYADIALDKAQRLEILINEFFDITRFNLTQMALEEETLNLTRMLEQIAHEFRPILAEKALSLDLQLAPGVQITCDSDKLRRVFDNLFLNAVNYSYGNGTIKVSLLQAEGNAIVQLANHGRTIPPDKLSRIFDQFFRLDASRSTSTGGAGLGLAIAKGIVELHGGTIAAESENEQIIFTVTLPCTQDKSP